MTYRQSDLRKAHQQHAADPLRSALVWSAWVGFLLEPNLILLFDNESIWEFPTRNKQGGYSRLAQHVPECSRLLPQLWKRYIQDLRDFFLEIYDHLLLMELLLETFILQF